MQETITIDDYSYRLNDDGNAEILFKGIPSFDIHTHVCKHREAVRNHSMTFDQCKIKPDSICNIKHLNTDISCGLIILREIGETEAHVIPTEFEELSKKFMYNLLVPCVIKEQEAILLGIKKENSHVN